MILYNQTLRSSFQVQKTYFTLTTIRERSIFMKRIFWNPISSCEDYYNNDKLYIYNIKTYKIARLE